MVATKRIQQTSLDRRAIKNFGVIKASPLRHVSVKQNSIEMSKVFAFIFVFCVSWNAREADGQLLAALGDLLSPITNFIGGPPGPPRPGFPAFPQFPGFFRGPGSQGGPFRDDGTQVPQATGRDELFPADCGRNEADGTGKLCFPDGLLCSQSESFHKIL